MMLRWLSVLLLSLLLNGCAATQKTGRLGDRPFTFPQDTFDYPNELIWEYQIDPATDQMVSHRREPPPQYALHCFVLARSARQFFQHACFDPSRPKVDEAAYRNLIRRITSENPRRNSWPADKILIPGYANLREFSGAHESLFKAESGGKTQSYFQRGNWRMIFPFSRRHQERTANQLQKSILQNAPPIIHLVRFPSLTINHSMLLFDCAATAEAIQFSAYDPNDPTKPTTLRYERCRRTFVLPSNNYFAGGRVDVYEIYHAINY